MHRTNRRSISVNNLGRALRAFVAALTFGVLAGGCDDNRGTDPEARRQGDAAPVPAAPPKPLPQQAEKPGTPPSTLPPNASPPDYAPGAAPSRARVIGTWTISGAPDGVHSGEKAPGTTYRFEEGGKVTVGGAKQCAYMIEASELKIDCGAALLAGRVEFRDADTMIWAIAGNERVTLKKR